MDDRRHGGEVSGGRWAGSGGPRLAGSLVDEGLGAGREGDKLLGFEPQVDLHLGVLQGVAAMDDVPEETQRHHVTLTSP